MPTNQTNVMTSHNLLNYSGMLFNKGNTKTPFSTLIGGKRRTANAFKFATSLSFTTGGGISQPAISETQSLTAPTPSFVTRTQETNVCQIFHKALSISYGKESSMGQLSGLNIAGQKANPVKEIDFQVANTMAEIGNDIEYTFVNGEYQDGEFDDKAYKTRGILPAITSNVLDVSGESLGFWIIAQLMKEISDGAAPIDGLVLMANSMNVMQLNADAASNGLTIVPNSRTENGIKLDVIKTPFGEIGILPNHRVPVGTAAIVNPSICAPVDLLVPGKENFFLEELSKKGASTDYQIYGQLGLDYGAEWYHGKITGLSTTFTAPKYSKKVYVAGGTITTETSDTTETE